MKRTCFFILSLFVLATCPPYLSAADKAVTKSDVEANKKEAPSASKEPLGYGASQATTNTTSMSMMGWGLGLAVVIAIVAGVIHQSNHSHHSSSSSGNNSGK